MILIMIRLKARMDLTLSQGTKVLLAFQTPLRTKKKHTDLTRTHRIVKETTSKLMTIPMTTLRRISRKLSDCKQLSEGIRQENTSLCSDQSK